MSTAIQRRRGSTSEHAAFTGLVGEITVDTTKKTVVVHDGATAGGVPLAKEAHNHDAAYIALSAIASAGQYRGNTAGKVLDTDGVWADAGPVNLGAGLSGNLALDLSAFINGYGTATGNVTFDAVSNPKSQSGTVRITASGGARTVSFNTAAIATPGNKALKAISSGTTMLYSYFYDSILGKLVILEIGLVS
jgi:hypothetical protein